jgi:hypothetical protein
MIGELQVPIIAVGRAALVAIDDLDQVPMQCSHSRSPNRLTSSAMFKAALRLQVLQ